MENSYSIVAVSWRWLLVLFITGAFTPYTHTFIHNIHTYSCIYVCIVYAGCGSAFTPATVWLCYVPTESTNDSQLSVLCPYMVWSLDVRHVEGAPDESIDRHEGRPSHTHIVSINIIKQMPPQINKHWQESKRFMAEKGFRMNSYRNCIDNIWICCRTTRQSP